MAFFSQEPADTRRFSLRATLGSFLCEGISSRRPSTQQLQHHGQCDQGFHRRQHSAHRPICSGQLLQTSGEWNSHSAPHTSHFQVHCCLLRGQCFQQVRFSTYVWNELFYVRHDSSFNLPFMFSGSYLHSEIDSRPGVE